jgi:hypothetical protein
LVLVVPAEEQDTAIGLTEGESERDERPRSPPTVEPGPSQQGEAKAKETTPLAVEEQNSPRQAEEGAADREEGRQEPPCHPAKKGLEEPKAVVKYKKVISRKKAANRARRITVSMPKEEEEIVDIGAKPRKRGRPRKNPSLDPLDPHKGSVLDPEKGGCADPVNRSAILGKGGPGTHSRRQRGSVEPR